MKNFLSRIRVLVSKAKQKLAQGLYKLSYPTGIQEVSFFIPHEEENEILTNEKLSYLYTYWSLSALERYGLEHRKNTNYYTVFVWNWVCTLKEDVLLPRFKKGMTGKLFSVIGIPNRSKIPWIKLVKAPNDRAEYLFDLIIPFLGIVNWHLKV